MESMMGITGGFGIVLDIERGESRRWVMGSDGVKRWADSGLPCEPPRCNECRYRFPDEIRDGDDYFWKDYCNLAEHGGRAIEINEGECCPDWCPLLLPNAPDKRLAEGESALDPAVGRPVDEAKDDDA